MGKAADVKYVHDRVRLLGNAATCTCIHMYVHNDDHARLLDG